MNKIKTIVSIFVILTIFSVCALSSLATIVQTSTYPVWNVRETAAYGVTDGNAPNGFDYYIEVDIVSNIGDHSYSYKHCTLGGSDTVSSSWVNGEYGAGMPLITLNGGYWIN